MYTRTHTYVCLLLFLQPLSNIGHLGGHAPHDNVYVTKGTRFGFSSRELNTTASQAGKSIARLSRKHPSPIAVITSFSRDVDSSAPSLF